MPSVNDDADPNDPTTGDPPTPDRVDDCRAAIQPFCRVFGGPTSHWVQFAGPESRPANSTDPEPNERPLEEPSRSPDAAFRTAGGRAIVAVLEHRMEALERALDPVRDACWRGDAPDAADLRVVRTRLAELQIAVEEYLARACPGTEPWESAGEHVPEARLVELLERGGCVVSVEDERTGQLNNTDSTEFRES